MDLPFSSGSDSCFYVSGDVQVHPSAAIASGVLLQADLGSRLVIGPNVSVGAKAVLHAQGGILSIAAQVTLGAGVLIMGHGRVGAGACIGANSTLLAKVGVEPGQMIDVGSILGEQALFSMPVHQVNQEVEAPGNHSDASSAKPTKPTEAASPEIETAPAEATPQPIQETKVYGRVVVERLLRMMSSSQQSPPGP